MARPKGPKAARTSQAAERFRAEDLKADQQPQDEYNRGGSPHDHHLQHVEQVEVADIVGRTRRNFWIDEAEERSPEH